MASKASMIQVERLQSTIKRLEAIIKGGKNLDPSIQVQLVNAHAELKQALERMREEREDD